MNTLKLTVKRYQWFRGQPSRQSKLLRHDGKMCCLGFAALASGYNPSDIREVTTPQSLATNFRTEKPMGVIARLVGPGSYDENYYKSTDHCGEIMQTNDFTIDQGVLGDTERECRLSWLFAKIDVEVTFED